MNVENQGFQDNDEKDDSSGDAVNLTAFALGEIADPAEINRLKKLLETDEIKHKDFDSTVHLASFIRDYVESDLPLAPGSLHDAVVAELSNGPSVNEPGMNEPGMNEPGMNEQGMIEQALEAKQANGKISPRSRKKWWLGKRAYALVTTLSLLLVCSIVIHQNWGRWDGTPTNLAKADPDAAPNREMDANIQTGKRTAQPSTVSRDGGVSGRESKSALGTADKFMELQFKRPQEKSALAVDSTAAKITSSGGAGSGSVGGTERGRAVPPIVNTIKNSEVFNSQAGGGRIAGGRAGTGEKPEGASSSRASSPSAPSPNAPSPNAPSPSARSASAQPGFGGLPASPGDSGRRDTRMSAGKPQPGLNNASLDGDRNRKNSGSANSQNSSGQKSSPFSNGKNNKLDGSQRMNQQNENKESNALPDGLSPKGGELDSPSEFLKRNVLEESANAPLPGKKSLLKAKETEKDSSGLSLRNKERTVEPGSKSKIDRKAADKDDGLEEKPAAAKQAAGELAEDDSEDTTPELHDDLHEFEPVDPAIENEFVQPIGTNAISTFSIDTDTASYTNVRQMLRAGQRPHPEDVRIEEMINYFDFNYQQPKAGERFSVNMELAGSPWSPGNRLLKVGLQARKVDNKNRPPSNLVFLIDVSGSMRKTNKLPLLKKGLNLMVDRLREDDYVSIVTYATGIRTPLEPTDGSQKEKIKSAINSLVAQGGTNGGEGLKTAYQLAEKHLLKDGTNRIVMGTDGDFNLGISDNRQLTAFVKEKSKSGVFLTICGFGTSNFQDQKVQIMAQNGNGKVYYIDSEEESKRVFADRISGSLVTIAKDVKLQLLFNPRTVQSYRLIGYENRMLESWDFDNDSKDAGEMDAGDSVTAIYEIVPSDGDFTYPTTASTENTVDLKYQVIRKQKVELTRVAQSNDIAALRIRYKEPRSQESSLREFVVKHNSTSFNRASKDFQLASTVAGLGMMLRGSRHRGTLSFSGLKELGQTVLAEPPTKPTTKKSEAVQGKVLQGKVLQGESQTDIPSVHDVRMNQRREIMELIERAEKMYPKNR